MIVPVAFKSVEVGLFASRDVTSLVSGLRAISTAFPISIESLIGSKNASIKSHVDVAVDEALFVFVLLLVLMMLETGVGCGDSDEIFG